MQTAQTFPVHPQPLKNESMTSWVARLAESNGASLHSLISSYQYNRRWDRRDLDYLGIDKIQGLLTAARVENGSSFIPSTLHRLDELCAQTGEVDRKSLISSTQVTRYCPLCLADDVRPYLRVSWRILFLPICSTHKILLQRGCWNEKCRHSQRLSKFNQDGKCVECGTRLGQAPLLEPQNCDELIRFSSMMEEILAGKSPQESDFPYGVKEFFLVLFLLIRYFNRYMPKEASWEQLGRNHGLEIKPPYDWKKNESLACIVLEQALRIAKEWSTCEEFIKKYRLRFRTLYIENNWEIPSLLRPLITEEGHNSEPKLALKNFRHYTSLSPEEKIQQAADFLFLNNRVPSFKSISKMVGISYLSIRKDPRLHSIITREKERFYKKQEVEIARAVNALKERGICVTIASVAAYLGRSDKFIRKAHLDAFKSCVLTTS